MLVKGGTIIKL